MDAAQVGKRGRKRTGRPLSNVNAQMAFASHHLVIDPCYLYVVNSLAHTLESFVTTLFLARTGSVPTYRASYSKNELSITCKITAEE